MTRTPRDEAVSHLRGVRRARPDELVAIEIASPDQRARSQRSNVAFAEKAGPAKMSQDAVSMQKEEVS
jgi:hypothetical protein